MDLDMDTGIIVHGVECPPTCYECPFSTKNNGGMMKINGNGRKMHVCMFTGEDVWVLERGANCPIEPYERA